MKYYLDSCALRYYLKPNDYKPGKSNVINIQKLINTIKTNTVVTDAVTVFEILNDLDNYQCFFDEMKRLDSEILMPFYDTKVNLKASFRKARDNKEYKQFFERLAKVVINRYALNLSKIIFHYAAYYLEYVNIYNEFDKLNKDDVIKHNKIISNILTPTLKHVTKVMEKYLCQMVRDKNFKEKNVLQYFDTMCDSVSYHWEKIKFGNIKLDNFYKQLNSIKDDILSDNFKIKHTCNYENCNLYHNYLFKDNQTIIKENTYDLYALNDTPITKLMINKLMNQIFIRKNKSIKLNDIKDAMIADNYLFYMKEHNEQCNFITFDNDFIKLLKKSDNVHIQQSLACLERFYI